MEQRDYDDCDKDEPKKSIVSELRDAGLFAISTFATILVLAYAAVVLTLMYPIEEISSEKLGQFGDTFGALTSLLNALAFAAVVTTVVLQSRELKESRRELRKQASSQAAWANAAARQLELTRQLEAVRIRPFIKAEWHVASESNHMLICNFWVRNVGLGVAIIRVIDLISRGKRFGTVTNADRQARLIWDECLKNCVDRIPELVHVRLMQFDDLNRALAPGETQILVSVEINASGDDARMAFARLQQEFRPIVKFEAMSGASYSTLDQFGALGVDDRSFA